MRLDELQPRPWSVAEVRAVLRPLRSWWRDLCSLPARLSMKGKA